MSTVATRDFLPAVPSRGTIRSATWFGWRDSGTLLFGVLLLAFALWQYDHRGDTALERLGKLGNLIAAPVPAFFILGIFSRRANTGGVICGAVVGILFVLALTGFSGVIEPVYDGVNWMWVGRPESDRESGGRLDGELPISRTAGREARRRQP